jgi:hypothetical protein
MGVRVAAYLVATGGEFAYLLGAQEARAAEHDRGDQESAAQSLALECVRYVERADAAIVESECDVGAVSE